MPDQTSRDQAAHLKVKIDLIVCISQHPTARLVTDVGASLFSGWGELRAFHYHQDDDAIELEFD